MRFRVLGGVFEAIAGEGRLGRESVPVPSSRPLAGARFIAPLECLS
jgi:hypothetical protein